MSTQMIPTALEHLAKPPISYFTFMYSPRENQMRTFGLSRSVYIVVPCLFDIDGTFYVKPNSGAI